MPNPRAVTAKPGAKFDAWSFSRYNDWVLCPFKAKLKHIMKLKEPGSPAMERGSEIHKLAENFVKMKAKDPCPPELATFEEEFRYLQAKGVGVETQWAFTSAWTSTGWFDRDAWCRLVVDLHWVEDLAAGGKRLILVDHKTGKINVDHEEQLSLYALGGLLKYPDVTEVKIELWYLDHGEVRPEGEKVYLRADLGNLKKTWDRRVKPMLVDTQFKPRPGDACRWCHWKAAKGGPCKF